MKLSTLTLSLTTLVAGTTLSLAQVPTPADPAPTNPTATNGAPTEAPAKSDHKVGSGNAMMKSGSMMKSHSTHDGKMAGHKDF